MIVEKQYCWSSHIAFNLILNEEHAVGKTLLQLIRHLDDGGL